MKRASHIHTLSSSLSFSLSLSLSLSLSISACQLGWMGVFRCPVCLGFTRALAHAAGAGCLGGGEEGCYFWIDYLQAGALSGLLLYLSVFLSACVCSSVRA